MHAYAVWPYAEFRKVKIGGTWHILRPCKTTTSGVDCTNIIMVIFHTDVIPYVT